MAVTRRLSGWGRVCPSVEGTHCIAVRAPAPSTRENVLGLFVELVLQRAFVSRNTTGTNGRVCCQLWTRSTFNNGGVGAPSGVLGSITGEYSFWI